MDEPRTPLRRDVVPRIEPVGDPPSVAEHVREQCERELVEAAVQALREAREHDGDDDDTARHVLSALFSREVIMTTNFLLGVQVSALWQAGEISFWEDDPPRAG